MKLTRVLSLLIRFLHTVILGFILFGSFSNNKWVLLFHLITIPTVILHWKINDDRCILTEWDLKLVGISPTDQQLKIFIHAVLLMSWTVSCFRFYLLV